MQPRQHGPDTGRWRTSGSCAKSDRQAQRAKIRSNIMPLSEIKALAFDVFGTVVDYRGTIISEGERLNREKGLSVDWAQFADAWRARYRPSMDRVMRGELPWTNLDALHRLSL